MPLPNGDMTYSSYVLYFAGYTVNTVPPEPFYYGAFSGNAIPKEVTIFDIYQCW